MVTLHDTVTSVSLLSLRFLKYSFKKCKSDFQQQIPHLEKSSQTSLQSIWYDIKAISSHYRDIATVLIIDDLRSTLYFNIVKSGLAPTTPHLIPHFIEK